MTEHNQEFETWLSDRLGHFNADGDVFSTYIFGILDGDESTDEKQTNLCDLLEGLGLDDGSPDPCQRIEKEIWAKWNNLGSKSSEEPIKQEMPKSDLGAALAAHAETQTKAYNAKGSSSKTGEDKDKEAVKAAILAQYGSSVFEESDEEEEASEDDDDVGSNANKAAVAQEQLEQRERSREAAKAKKDKDKEDREKQKKDAEERKKKAQDKSSKVERKR